MRGVPRMVWYRVRAQDKLAFREDLQSDPTLSDLQKRMISTIATHCDGERMAAECSLSFIAAGAGTTKKMAAKYSKSLVESGRVTVARAATFTGSTLWTVNWWFRGSAWVRAGNGGQAIMDCRAQSPTDAHGESPTDAEDSPPGLHMGVPQRCQGGVPQAGDQFLPEGRDIGAPSGARPDGGAQKAPSTNQKEKQSRAMPGFAKWRIVHAEFEGEDEDVFVAHLRSGTDRKFVMRCNVDSDDYASIDGALGIDGEPASVIGELVQMSTNRTGVKEFRRAAPLPWSEAEILDGDSLDDGRAKIRIRFDGDHEGNMNLSAVQAIALADACGGEQSAIGSVVRYRLMPDDSMEFRLLHGPGSLERAAA